MRPTWLTKRQRKLGCLYWITLGILFTLAFMFFGFLIGVGVAS